MLRLQDQITLGSLTFQCKGVGVGVETMKYEKFWEISKFHAGGDDKQFAWPNTESRYQNSQLMIPVPQVGECQVNGQ